MDSDAETMKSLQEVFETLPCEKQRPEEILRRIRIVTDQGRTIFAFLRAGAGPLAFAGWDATRETDESGEPREPVLDHFVLGAEQPGAALHVISRHGLLGKVMTVDVEDRSPEESER